VLEQELHVWAGELDREASHTALRCVLARYLDEDPAAIEFRVGEHGKPALADPATALRFNLSHSGDLALIAVAEGREVGVDVERIRPRRNLLRLAERALDPAAAAAVRAAPPEDRLTAFHTAWTRHEAIAKCHGVGLRGPLPATPVVASSFDAGPDFAAALAVAGKTMPPVKRFALAAGRRQRSGHRHPANAPR
jgi:4'-phosphopantetheinyl transferase